jgi:pimeloyl-ACP methyl ester carboxylesterase
MSVSNKNIVLIPGTLCTELLWTAQTKVLSKYANVSVAKHTGHIAISSLAKDILEQAPEYFSLVGFSFGGFLVFELLRQAPERIQRVVLMNTNAKAADPEFERPLSEAFIERASVNGIEDIAKEFIPYFVRQESQDSEEMIRTITTMAKDIGAKGYIEQTKASLGRVDSRLDLPGIRSPVLLIGARNDVLTPPLEQEDMLAAMPIAKLEIIEECGHLSPLEKPTQVSELVADWLF